MSFSEGSDFVTCQVVDCEKIAVRFDPYELNGEWVTVDTPYGRMEGAVCSDCLKRVIVIDRSGILTTAE
jgi:hypothetical protein